MTTLFGFLEELFQEGHVRLSSRPILSTEEEGPVLRFLKDAWEGWTLALAGPVLKLEPKMALAASRYLADACWFLISREEPAELVEQTLVFPLKSQSPSEVLSVDLCLRFLPVIYRRSQLQSTTDVLTQKLTEVLRHWPLSGVLSDVPDAPIGDCNFHGHTGLQMLYAERLLKNPKAEWFVTQGPTYQWIELVFQQQHRSMPTNTPKDIYRE